MCMDLKYIPSFENMWASCRLGTGTGEICDITHVTQLASNVARLDAIQPNGRCACVFGEEARGRGEREREREREREKSLLFLVLLILLIWGQDCLNNVMGKLYYTTSTEWYSSLSPPGLSAHIKLENQVKAAHQLSLPGLNCHLSDLGCITSAVVTPLSCV